MTHDDGYLDPLAESLRKEENGYVSSEYLDKIGTEKAKILAGQIKDLDKKKEKQKG